MSIIGPQGYFIQGPDPSPNIASTCPQAFSISTFHNTPQFQPVTLQHNQGAPRPSPRRLTQCDPAPRPRMHSVTPRPLCRPHHSPYQEPTTPASPPPPFLTTCCLSRIRSFSDTIKKCPVALLSKKTQSRPAGSAQFLIYLPLSPTSLQSPNISTTQNLGIASSALLCQDPQATPHSFPPGHLRASLVPRILPHLFSESSDPTAILPTAKI